VRDPIQIALGHELADALRTVRALRNAAPSAHDRIHALEVEVALLTDQLMRARRTAEEKAARAESALGDMRDAYRAIVRAETHVKRSRGD